MHEDEMVELGLADPLSPEETQINIAPRVLSEANVYQIDSMLKDVIKYGTGKRAMTLNRRDLAVALLPLPPPL